MFLTELRGGPLVFTGTYCFQQDHQIAQQERMALKSTFVGFVFQKNVTSCLETVGVHLSWNLPQVYTLNEYIE